MIAAEHHGVPRTTVVARPVQRRGVGPDEHPAHHLRAHVGQVDEVDHTRPGRRSRTRPSVPRGRTRTARCPSRPPSPRRPALRARSPPARPPPPRTRQPTVTITGEQPPRASVRTAGDDPGRSVPVPPQRLGSSRTASGAGREEDADRRERRWDEGRGSHLRRIDSPTERPGYHGCPGPPHSSPDPGALRAAHRERRHRERSSTATSRCCGCCGTSSGLTGTHYGCGIGVCGCCTVLVDGRAGAELPGRAPQRGRVARW